MSAPGTTVSTLDVVRELLPTVRRYSVAPGVLFAVPGTLKFICAFLGFRNSCRDGKVYITPTKIQCLERYGLAAPIHGSPEGWS